MEEELGEGSGGKIEGRFACSVGRTKGGGMVSCFFFSSRRRHTRSSPASWARRCVEETGDHPPAAIMDRKHQAFAELVVDRARVVLRAQAYRVQRAATGFISAQRRQQRIPAAGRVTQLELRLGGGIHTALLQIGLRLSLLPI